jgi:phosphate transport system substrate-binding protein
VPAQPRAPKQVSPVALGAAILVVLLIVGGGIAVLVIASGGPSVPTPKPLPPPTGELANKGGPAPPDHGNNGKQTGPNPKQPDPKENTKPPEKKSDPPLAGTQIHGSGSTFIKPAMEYWTNLYELKTGVKIKYDGIGSGRGVENMIDKVLDFGCTDAYLTDPQIKKAKEKYGEVVHVPLALGAVVVTYNLEIKQQLRFSGEVLVDIYLGKITKWNDPAIVASNPGVATDLPNLDITVIRRSDVSGTTAIWTEYLSKVKPEWADKVGTGTTVKWPVGEDAEKNDGVAKAVSRKPGAIGYVELSFALERNLKYAQVRNVADEYIQPTLESVTAAANASIQAIGDDLRYSLTNAAGKESYPISGTTWLVVYADQSAQKQKGKELVRFLNWCVTDGQPKLKDLRYAPLPEKLASRVRERIGSIQTSE